MPTSIQDLVARLRRNSSDSSAFDALVEALREAAPVEILTQVRSDVDSVRRAVIVASVGRPEPELIRAVAPLAHDSRVEVRSALAQALDANPDWPLLESLETLVADANDEIRMTAARAASKRPSLVPLLTSRLTSDSAWRVRQAIAESLGRAAPRAALPALLGALHSDNDSDVQRACALALERQLEAHNGFPADVPLPPYGHFAELRKRVADIRGGSFPQLLRWLDYRIAHDIDFEQLRAFGSILSEDAERLKLPRAYEVDTVCDSLIHILTGPGIRAAVLLGESGAGKTALVNELVHRLHDHPDGTWHVIRVTPTEFLAGTSYLGEWQTKLRNLIQAVQSPRRVIVYIPNINELAMIGTTNKSDANIATSLAPHIERGAVAILGESNPESYRTGLGSVASVNRLFQPVNVPSATADQTRAILSKVSHAAGLDAPDSSLASLTELADLYLTGSAQPGRAVGLLRRVLAAGHTTLTPRIVLETLSSTTGIPVDFLDEGVSLEPAKVREHLGARVRGQPEAVDAMTDLMMMVKSGLCDPYKPFGVYLFIGPTGVGKTEMARTVAGLIFGDPSRLVRLDMTEFAGFDAHERLMGWPGRPGLLTGPIRDQPFSVILLDEIEKAHGHVYDLCLQIFDAGRLTDAAGRTTDFRRTIIIMTSNIGYATKEAPVGFDRKAAGSPSRDQTLRELSRWFRPEFLNRLDQVVTFRQLSAEDASEIARGEVDRVLQRGGITRRRLAVDIDQTVMQLLLREGYSPTFGARPLKRTVERRVLLPVARAISAGQVPPGALVRLTARGDLIHVHVERPDGEPRDTPTPKPESPKAALLAERVAALCRDVARLREKSVPLGIRKTDCVARTAATDFWNDRPAALRVYDDIYRLDGVLQELTRIETAAHELADWVAQNRGSERDLVRLSRKLETVERHAKHVDFLVSCRDPRDLGDAFIVLSRVAAHGNRLDAVGKLASMYIGLAKRRGLTTEVISDRPGNDPRDDSIVLMFSGAGAFALLAGEVGLHQVVWGQIDKAGESKRRNDREVVRVEVLRYPLESEPPETIRETVTPVAGQKGRLMAKPKIEVQLIHSPTLLTVRGWSDKSKKEAIERFAALLRAHIEFQQSGAAIPLGDTPVRRRYRLGPTTQVKDLRTNKVTGRLDRVLEGDLDMFLISLESTRPATENP
jgi:ATP-dependent Clp protease ATP-binding subunit ClpA/protein subunit release factor B